MPMPPLPTILPAILVLPHPFFQGQFHMAGNAVIGQSGGPTAVINQSLVGVIEALTAAQKQGKIGKILGAKHGGSGIINNDFVALDNLSHDLLERVAQTPSSALGSTRDKPDEAYCNK